MIQIEIKDLQFAYPRKEVLKGVTMSVKPGHINGLVGMNGAGKTTLLRCISRELEFNKGSIVLNPADHKNGQIAFLETENYFYPKMKGREYLELCKFRNPDFAIDKWNRLFDLPLNDLVDSYSTGMKKKLAFLGIIALDRPVMILDEPFNGVDLESNEKIKLILRQLSNAGKTILITSHILEAMIRICDSIDLLSDGIIAVHANREEFPQLQTALESRVHEQSASNLQELFQQKSDE